MKIRRLNDRDDRMALSRIYEKSWRFAYQGIIPQDYLDGIPAGRWAHAFDRPGTNTLVCEENRLLIGAVCLCRSRFNRWPEAGEIISIYFLPEWIGFGYGRQLMRSALDELKKQGFRTVFLWTLEDNVRARRFYERIGFICTGDIIEDCIGGKNLREIRYEITLEP